MKIGKRKPTGREKDEESIVLLERLREALYAEDVSRARRAAFNLSWLQEDGLDILKEALFGKASRRTKTAATYGLRSMRGRMKKTAMELLAQGLKSNSNDTKTVCEHSLALMRAAAGKKPATRRKSRTRRAKVEIREIPSRAARRRSPNRKTGNEHPLRGRHHFRR